MTRTAFLLAATAALVILTQPAFAESRLFSVRSDKPGVTIDQALANDKGLTVAGKGGGVTFFRMDNPAGAIDCHQHVAFVASTGERQESLGCDLYTFRRGLIVMKDTYIKVVA